MKKKSKVFDLLEGEGIVRTDMHCTNCSKSFVGEIDFDIDGNHVIICPYCGHEHCRVIKNGKITDDRWDSRLDNVETKTQRVWRDGVLKMKTSTASAFIRHRWLNLGREA